MASDPADHRRDAPPAQPGRRRWLHDPLVPLAAGMVGVLGLAWQAPRLAFSWVALLLLGGVWLLRRTASLKRQAGAAARLRETLPWFLALLALLAPVAARRHALALERSSAQHASAERKQETARVERRKDALVSWLLGAADEASRLSGITGARGARLARLFEALEAVRARHTREDAPALAIGVYSPSLQTLAWAGRTSDLTSLRGLLQERPDVLVLSGTVATTLVAVVPVHGPRGEVAVVAAETMVRGAAPSGQAPPVPDDFLVGDIVGARIVYYDSRSDAGAPSEGALVLRSPGGATLAVVDFTPEAPSARRAALLRRYRLGAVVLLVSLLVFCLAARPSWGRALAAATALRAVLTLFETSASGGSAIEDRILGLWTSPLDVALTAAWSLLLALAALRAALARGRHQPSWIRALGADLATLPVLGATFLALRSIVHRWPLDVEAVDLLPPTPEQLLLRLAMLSIITAGASLLVACLTAGTARLPASRRIATRLVLWPLLLLGLMVFRGQQLAGNRLPLLPIATLAALAWLAAATRPRWQEWLLSASAYSRALAFLGLLAAVTAIAFLSVVHFTEGRLRRRVEHQYVAMVRDQPRWRREVLRRSCRQLDALQPLTAFPASPMPVDEVALAAWSRTDLARYGFSSALEILDPEGRPISRFGQNLAWLTGPSGELPQNTSWEISPARVAVGSASRTVLHARRLVVRDGEILGSLHLYVGDDHANLPFLALHRPHSLARRAPPEPGPPGRGVALVVYDGQRVVRFSSAERPPPLAPQTVRRLADKPAGFWATTMIDGRPHATFFFRDGDDTVALAYPRLDALWLAASTVEAITAVLLTALVILLLLATIPPLFRPDAPSLLGLYRRIQGSFTLRLTLAFLIIAAVPVLALQIAIRTFLGDRLRREADRQALEHVMVARKAVEDFITEQGRESPASRPITDAALVWVASLVRNDVDAFERGTLLASSRRELFDAHLLPKRIDGAVYRALALEGQPFLVATDRAGNMPYQLISVPFRLRPGATGILAMPLASRGREARAVLTDVENGMRLALLLFLAGAAILAHSMATHISRPIAALTDAAEHISHGDLATRVATASRDELRGLVEAFNRMAGDLDRQREELERSHRLAAWTDMARQVAHEVKNPLTPIQLSAEHLRRVHGDPAVDFSATLATCTETILKQVRSLRRIVSEFSAFARPPEVSPQPLDLSALVAEALRPYQAALPPGIAMELVLAPVPPVRGDRRLLERVVVNLLENALQAVGDAGTITVRVAADPAWVHVEVVDSGPGIAPEVQRQLFRPFFSTKEGGSGLGLALVRKIARDHGGDVRIESRPGHGTRALVDLPRAADGPHVA